MLSCKPVVEHKGDKLSTRFATKLCGKSEFDANAAVSFTM